MPSSNIDECSRNDACGVGALCHNLPGSHTCECPEGSVPDPDPKVKCVGVVMCNTEQDCPGNAICDDKKRCYCPEPNVGNDCRHPCEDLSCGPNAQCMLVNNLAKCICSHGYTGSASAGSCLDINECAGNPCPPGAVCNNEPGSFSCECPGGFGGDPYREGCTKSDLPFGCSADKPCPGGEQCIKDDFCQAPYQIVNGNCVLAGCSKGEKCPVGAECITIAGGVSYCACPKGFRTKHDGSCEDINECTEGRHVCGYGAECINKLGAHECKCPRGYSGDPYNGVCSPDQVRCVSDGDCSSNEKCVQPGECVCPPPFFSDPLDANKCKSPCERFPCGINSKCTPSDPPKCMCETGYKGDPLYGCVDIDECADNPCAYGAHCLNEKGGYKCVCARGMTGDAYKSGCVGTLAPKGECSTNDDCAGQLACVEGACVNPCNALPCGHNAYCEADNHAAWCRCTVGYVEGSNGDCVSLCSGIICGQNAVCIPTASGPTCACPEGFLGNPFPGGACTPDVCSSTNPCVEPRVCIGGRCKQRCEGVVCGVGATCDHSTNKCVCDPFFVGNPELVCMPPFVYPLCAPGCGKNAHCEYGIVNQCVCNAGTSGNPYEGCGSQVKKSCSTTICGVGAQCKEGINSVECVCPRGFNGNPYVHCQDVNECSGNACGSSAVCINTPGSYDCRCKEGYAGNPFVLCLPISHGTCDNPATCKCSKDVVCPSGFSCDAGRCKNPCESVKCGPRAACDAGKCVCPPGSIGDPSDLSSGCKLRGQCNNDLDCSHSEICFQLGKGIRKCVDACGKIQCGPNALCVAENHRSSCICTDGYLGNPSDLTLGCQPERTIPTGECDTDRDCSKGLVCAVNLDGRQVCVDPCANVACAQNEVCHIDNNGHPACNCLSSFVWNPVSSACEKPSLPDCTADHDCKQVSACRPDALGVLKCTPVCLEFTCPSNAICVSLAHQGQCQCLPGYTGNPNDRNGCRPALKNQCTTDAQCSESDTCRQDGKAGALMCKPACDLIKCGPHALCLANNHVAQCQCPPGPFAGDPNDPVVGCKTVPCVYNIDCPPTQLCNRLTHTCYDVCEEDACGLNAVCIAENHQATCQCPPGFRGNPLPDIECVSTEVCSPNPCHPSAMCEGSPSGHICRCPPGHVGDPFTSGCRPEGNCPNGDSDCPPHSSCLGGRCINPCDGTCGPNALCNVVNRKAICSCPNKFVAGPSGPNTGCLRLAVECSSDADCKGDVCHNGQCKAVCRNIEDCTYGERCVQSMCLLPCAGHSQCSDGQACSNGFCHIGCRASKDCPSEHACINNKCQDPCKREGVCGANAVCRCVNHATECLCPEGFVGSPVPQQGCVRIPTVCSSADQCPSGNKCSDGMCALTCTQSDKCALGERCSGGLCVKVCYGDSNCLAGEVCLEGECRPGCASESDCKESQVCIHSKCRCGSGFESSPSGCQDINECEDSPCHSSAECSNIPGSYRCVCPDKTVGDPFLDPGCVAPDQCRKDSDCSDTLACVSGRCTDPCVVGAGAKCGPSAVCNVFDHQATCSCPAGHLGDPNNVNVGCFKVECITSEDCSFEKFCDGQTNKCTNPCDQVDCGRGSCKAQNHEGLCACSEGYTLVSGKCADIDECTQNPFARMSPVPSPARVPTVWWETPSRWVAENPEIVSLTQTAQPARRVWTTGARIHATRGMCAGKTLNVTQKLTPLYVDVPLRPGVDAKVECVHLECSDSNDCSGNKACIDFSCIDPCSLPNVCGQRADCTPVNHVGVCICQAGCTGDPHLGCVPVLYCAADVQCPAGTKCNNGICTSVCTSSRECIGDQLCIQGVCQPTCKSNESCPQFQFCQNSICVQEVKCRSDDDCDSTDKCRENAVGQAECVNACDGPVLCGRNAECAAHNHEAVCTCKTGYHGNPKDDKSGCQPIECTTDLECSNDKLCDTFKCRIACLAKNPCGVNALCSAENHRQVCYCQPGFTGDALLGCKLIDLCAENPCGPGARCENSRGTFKCHCPQGLVGDPYTAGCQTPVECNKDEDCPDAAKCTKSNGVPKCKAVCETTKCGPNAECAASKHVAKCVCREAYEGNPNDRTIGCRPKPVPCRANTDCSTNTYCYQDICRAPCLSDGECSLTEKCLQGQCRNPCDGASACGMNAECRVFTHQKQCSCPPGFTGNHDVECVRIPVSCESNQDCSRNNTCRDSMCLPTCPSDNECAFNEKCLKGNCMLTCRVDNDCFLGHICLHNMCVFGCHSDEDCGASESCRDNRCSNPCSPNPCGPNAACTVSNQRASCSCTKGFVPNPSAKVACVRTPAAPCSENRDCPSSTTCLVGSCLPVCSSNTGCLSNERCDPGSGVCRPLCRRDQDCRSGEVCEGLVCAVGCRSDSGCPADRACINSKCEDLCTSPTACGTNAGCTMRDHQKECICPAPLTGDPTVGCRQPIASCSQEQGCPSGYTCYAGTCQATCTNDLSCLSDERCVSGLCRAICNSDSKCGTRQICENRLCVIGCRSDTVCPDDQACIDKQCRNPCDGATTCGACATCRVVNHGVQCSCPGSFFGNPLIGCSRPAVRCGSPGNQDCAECDEAGYCTKSCNHPNDCACGEACANGKCRIKCSGAIACEQGHICENTVCVAGCRTQNDCPNDRACVNSQCRDPCTAGESPCGENALCRVSEHRAVCLCPDGYQGEPSRACTQYECTKDEDCESNKRCSADRACRNPCLEPGACGSNAQCRVVSRRAQCSCPPGYFGNSQVECKQGGDQCLRNPCGENTRCRDLPGGGFECSCAPGCAGDANRGCLCGGTLKDLCRDKKCGVNAVCLIESNGQPECHCPPDYPAGNPYRECSIDRTPADCRTNGCGSNAECLREGAVFLCRCLPGTSGRPDVECRAENACSSDYDCPNEKACVNSQCTEPCSLRGACGENALCRVVLHKPRCSCPQCYVGMPHEACTPDPKCDTDSRPNLPGTGCARDSDCADHHACNRAAAECQDPCRIANTFACDANKKCEVQRHKPMCVCKSGFVVNDVGELTCAPDQVECARDQECASNLACIESKCQNPCTALRKLPCSLDKTCDVLDHKPVCICTKDCNPTLSICLRDHGCPAHLACRGYRCVDPCSNVTCTDDAPCYVEEHKPVCKFCPQGYVTDSKYGCLKAGESSSTSAPVRCTLDAECTDSKACIRGECVDPCTNLCGNGSQCKAQAHRPICYCLEGHHGNPLIECMPFDKITRSTVPDSLATTHPSYIVDNTREETSQWQYTTLTPGEETSQRQYTTAIPGDETSQRQYTTLTPGEETSQ
ncbi:unnamed protein product, partial [Timema podura]|nr:unnamed protein product [Timema podura]